MALRHMPVLQHRAVVGPMFASGSARLEDYAVTILTQIGAALSDVENRVSIAGHTDVVPYSGVARTSAQAT